MDAARHPWRAMLAALLLAAPFAAHAQPAKLPKVGVLSLDSPGNPTCVDGLRRGLAQLGHVDGRTYVLEPRWANDRVDVLPALAAELVKQRVDVIVSAAVIWKDVTTSVPVVLASSFYAVESGVVQSLAHPGGNVTGLTLRTAKAFGLTIPQSLLVQADNLIH